MDTLKHVLLTLAIVAGCAASGPVRADDFGQYPIATKGGELQSIDIGNRLVVIEGVRYLVAVDVDVTINDSYGAFTMLSVGMYLRYEYEAMADDHRRIVSMRAYTGRAGREAA